MVTWPEHTHIWRHKYSYKKTQQQRHTSFSQTGTNVQSWPVSDSRTIACISQSRADEKGSLTGLPPRGGEGPGEKGSLTGQSPGWGEGRGRRPLWRDNTQVGWGAGAGGGLGQTEDGLKGTRQAWRLNFHSEIFFRGPFLYLLYFSWWI
jgi:hypothetical protein